MCKLQPTRVCQLLTCLVPSRPHQGGEMRYCAPSGLYSLSTSPQLPHSLSLFVTLLFHTPSHALYLHLSVSGSLPSLLSYPSFPVCLPGVKSSLILFASVTCLSFFCSVFSPHSTSSLATSHPKCSSELKPHYLCLSWLVFSLLPLVLPCLSFSSILFPLHLLSSFSWLLHIFPS